jgi:putative zinc finger/helix-turn-helix YgiT family protein
MQYDGRAYSVEVPELHAPRCTNCGAIVLDDQANDQITDALRRQIGLLTPEQIRRNRESLGLKQRDFAIILGVGESTVSRWETGTQIQQRSLDKLMRLYFAFPEARDALADKDRLATLGSDVVIARPVLQPVEATTKAVAVESLGAVSIQFRESSPSDETRHFRYWKECRDRLVREPTRYKLAHTTKFYSCLLRSFREERKKTDPADLFLENMFSSRHDLLATSEEVSPDVASLLPVVSCWAILTDATTRTQWRSLFERAVEALSDVSTSKIVERGHTGRWFVAPLLKVQSSDLDQSERLSRLASRLDILPPERRKSVLVEYERLTELIAP